MNNRREFFAKLVASGLGVIPALKQSEPLSETHKLEKDALYALVIPGLSPDGAYELQEWLNSCDGPRFMVFPFQEIQIYRL